MADVIAIAGAVAAELTSYGAEVLFCPEYELRDLEEMKVCVVPLAVQYKTCWGCSAGKLPQKSPTLV